MFPPIPSSYRKPFLALILVFGIAAGATVYLLQTTQIEFATAAAAFLGAVLAVVQWMTGQLREAARSTWEAVQAYYVEGDDETLAVIRTAIHEGNFEKAYVFCNFYEKWGRLVKLSYLPLEIFDGPSGMGIANAAVKLRPFLLERRAKNPRYAESYIWLLSRVQKSGYLAGTVTEGNVHVLLAELQKRP